MTPEELAAMRAVPEKLIAVGDELSIAIACIVNATINHIDAQAAEIERLRADNAGLLKAVINVQEERDLAQAEFRTYHRAWEEGAARTQELEAQVAALKEIAEWERASRLRDQVDYETDDEMMPEFCRDAIRQLSEEHPEAMR